MAKENPIEPIEPPALEETPSEGGSYIRNPDGTLTKVPPTKSEG